MKQSLNKYIKIVLLVIILILFIVFIVILNNDSNTKENITKEEIKLEYKNSITINIGDEVPTISDYKLNDVEVSSNIKWNDEREINYYASEYTGVFKYKGEDITIKLIVEDKEAPVISNVKDITIYEDDKIDLLKDIKITDNSKDDIKIVVNGNYDFSKSGTYSLSYQASDISGNITTKNFKLIVKENVVVSNNTKENSSAIVGKTSKGYEIKKIDGIYYINGILIANKTYKLPSNYAPGGLLSEFVLAFTEMKNDAKKEGITLKIVSGYRSYSTQNTIYNRYVSRNGKSEADTYSARPGHSEHQTGLAADLNLIDSSFENTKEGKWLSENCYKYGFILRYPKGKESYTGYIFEPWHFRYIGDEAINLYNNGSWISLEEYLGIDSKY